MAVNNNSREGKRQKRFEAHNRKPGMAKFWKSRRSRKSRRRSNKVANWMVEGKWEIS